MASTDIPIAQLKAELFKTLAHPVRVRALEQLIVGERSVSELAAALRIEISHLSQQLAVLRRAGLVSTRREGTTIFYAIRDTRISRIFAVAREMLVTTLEDSHSLLASLREGEAAK